MKNDTLNDVLIKAMKAKIPKGVNLAHVLMNTLYIGKEAVYRRLRGEVPFTFVEASIISNSFGVSLDVISGNSSRNNVLFGLNMMDYSNPINTYCANMEDFIRIVKVVKDDPDARWYIASNVIPHVFCAGYSNLSRFLLYKWMYQHEKINSMFSFSRLVFNEKLKDILKRYLDTCKDIAHSTFILDDAVILFLLREIEHFMNINMLTKEEMLVLKKEMLSMISYMEELATKGHYKNGNMARIYISNVHFDSSYGYIETDNYKYSHIRLYSINRISTTDQEVFKHQKEWVNSLKKYSTLISISGEMQRIQFFQKQREYINALGV
ncbi:hypothetical protein M2459_001161 [Parabacteroides sp. PF5-5]|uniref:hypothetical protein n=1 Tax=unclassified Parabacteroides TaxID=2649774 RepID=UPI002476D7B3|nr:MULTISPECIES: hypothetical protein [unclassified Parabacteroides]MDH6304428.1 hypothetical protein [Parabacteroides sp. PH5-39]MDH6315419.1 hypothetical protein [Parabacteroides sp. PF5-13]MDH6319087.1 hypothetical protein [Parabacteroides sp. PH5-13]MDH6322817.1 hypothetical protein [Parabacteroides sp. PH5-8]MDH6326611.1 hypothetical protein [Parabacteroides sp. PH5-41]